MTDPTPPPEQPMDDAARARVRSRLLEETRLDPHPHRPWLVPIGAAAAVLVIAFGAGWAAFGPGEGPRPAPAPATTTPSAAPDTTPVPTPSAEPAPPTSPPDPVETLPEQTGQIAREGCEKAARRPLGRQAGRLVSWPLPHGEASVWATDDGRSVLCAQNAEITTLHEVRRHPAGPVEPSMLGWSTDTYHAPEGQVTAYVAGGPLPAGVTSLSYAFPGQTVPAEVRDGWWLVAHAPTEGPLADPRVNYLELPPVTVTVDGPGVRESFELSWPEHMCAQVNHGC